MNVFERRFTRPEIERRYKSDVLFRVAVDVGHKHDLENWMVYALQQCLAYVHLESRTPQEQEHELRGEAEQMVKYALGEIGKVYSLPSLNG
ncbi:MAG TPA: hypothetical protein VFU31_24965 [Candidatus Binatia bacterium]|nr:hypothetical protein [Candidatus Binatia bacterium]